MEIGKVIKQLRIRKGYNQSELAKLCDLSQTALSQIETGATSPHDSNLEIIAEKLGVPKPVMYFLCLDENDVPEERRESFRVFYPVIQRMIDQIYLPNSGEVVNRFDSAISSFTNEKVK